MTQEHLIALNHGRLKGSDEQYTDYGEIDQELKHYVRYLRNKRIYLPCDNSRSNFVKWFKKHPELGCKVTYTSDDFRKPANRRRMADQDIVITNPPFSLLKEFLVPILEANKPVILIMPALAVVYVGIGKFFHTGRLHIGFTEPMKFIMPDGTVKRNNQCIWQTNIPIKVPYRPIVYSNKAVSQYPADIDGKGIIISTIKDVPRTTKPLLIPITPSALRYADPSRYAIDERKCRPRIEIRGGNNRKGGNIKYVFQKLRIRRKTR